MYGSSIFSIFRIDQKIRYYRSYSDRKEGIMKEISITELKQKLDESLEENVIIKNIPLEFSQDLLDLSADDFPDDCDYRKDLRHQCCITIDDEDTKDIDDALFLEEIDKGYRLWVHIADVSSFLRYDDELYDEAESRATSIYLPDRVIRMLPPLFSEDLCSLKAGEDRKAMSFCIDLDENSNPFSLKVFRSLIHPFLKCSYPEVEQLIEGNEDPKICDKYDQSTMEMIKKLDRIAEKLATGRNKELSTARKKIKVTDSQLIIESKQQFKAERLVEEFMVLTNKEVSRFMYEKKLPAIYRIQDDSDAFASYSCKNLGHKDLNISARQGGYVYVTSPIRRFSDCVNQMILTSYLDGDPMEEIHDEFHEEYLESVSFFLTKKSIRGRSLSGIQNRICEGFYLKIHSENEMLKGYLYERFFKEGQAISKFQVDLNDVRFILTGELSAVPMHWYGLKLKNCPDGSVEVASCIPIKEHGE